MQIDKSIVLFERAKRLIPGGVNSPVRAFQAVGGQPLFIKRAEGAYLYDEDGNCYIDCINSWGPMILGHAYAPVLEAIQKTLAHSTSFGAPTRLEVEMAELIVHMVPSIEMVRMVNSGTEATMAAIRLARGYTGRHKIIKFEGCYHGHGDSFLIAAGSGAATTGVPNSPGVTPGVAQDTLVAPYNDLHAVEQLIEQYPNQIAAIIVEPVAGNMGCVLPRQGYLQGLRQLCDQHGIVLIFDEVMTGFRLAPGGAQERFGVVPDLTTLGKIIGAGLPVGAYGGRREIMQQVSPVGKVYQAGTLSGNPVAMAAGLALLQELNDKPEIYARLETIGDRIYKGMLAALEKRSLQFSINKIGSMLNIFFTSEAVVDFQTAKTSNLQAFAAYFHAMLRQGVYLAPSQFESWFCSAALTDTDIDHIVQAHANALDEVMEKLEQSS